MEVTGWKPINNFNIGIVRGVGTSEDGTRGMNRVQSVTTLEQCMLMLALHRVEVVVFDFFSSVEVIKRKRIISSTENIGH